MSHYKLIVFDWDGTLVDSTKRIVDSMQKAAKLVGMSALPDTDVKNIIGLGLPEAIKTLWPNVKDEEAAQLAPEYTRFFVTDSTVEMGMFAGAREMLEELAGRGYLLAVATGKTRNGLDRMMRDLKVGHLFSITRCADETRSKPHPLMLHEILNAMSVAAHEALMVGDTSFDLDMASAAEMPSLAMSHGAHDMARLKASKPLDILHNINELRDWIITHG